MWERERGARTHAPLAVVLACVQQRAGRARVVRAVCFCVSPIDFGVVSVRRPLVVLYELEIDQLRHCLWRIKPPAGSSLRVCSAVGRLRFVAKRIRGR